MGIAEESIGREERTSTTTSRGGTYSRGASRVGGIASAGRCHAFLVISKSLICSLNISKHNNMYTSLISILSRQNTNVQFAWKKLQLLIGAYSFAVGKEHAEYVLKRMIHVIKVSKSNAVLFVGTQILVAVVRNGTTMC